jgi:hypothetical protein
VPSSLLPACQQQEQVNSVASPAKSDINKGDVKKVKLSNYSKFNENIVVTYHKEWCIGNTLASLFRLLYKAESMQIGQSHARELESRARISW